MAALDRRAQAGAEASRRAVPRGRKRLALFGRAHDDSLQIRLVIVNLVDPRSSFKRGKVARSPAIIQLSLKPVFQEALKRRADQLGLTEAEAGASLIEQGLAPFLRPGPEMDQARAERELLELASSLAREEVKKSREWNERLTLAVFERIRLEHGPLYEQVLSGGTRDAVNPRVARQVKTSVGARVKKRDGRPVTLKAPRGADALIGNYTLLLPPD